MVIAAGLLGVAAGAAAERYGLTLPSLTGFKGAIVPNDLVIEGQALAMFKAKVQASEGYRRDVYRDPVFPNDPSKWTVGIGHKVLPEDNLKLGDVISDERVQQLFIKDTSTAFNAAKSQARELNKYNPEMIAALAEVNYQLGIFWRSKFPNTWSLIKSGKINPAISALYGSAWYKQTPNRVIAFVNVLKSQYA